jgi:hypothetical protein
MITFSGDANAKGIEDLNKKSPLPSNQSSGGETELRNTNQEGYKHATKAHSKMWF